MAFSFWDSHHRQFKFWQIQNTKIIKMPKEKAKFILALTTDLTPTLSVSLNDTRSFSNFFASFVTFVPIAALLR